MESAYILLDHVRGFFVKDQKLFITCCANFVEGEAVEICECKDPEIMKKKEQYLLGLLDKYYASKISHNTAFAPQYFISVDRIAKHGEIRK